MTFTKPSLYDGRRWEGLRVGLFGGSFNPAHAGHRHVAEAALAHCHLDFIWWLVSPQNPLKSKCDTAPYQERFSSVEKIIANHPKMMATDLESSLKTTFTYETITLLQNRYPRTSFTLICGTDNALIFHRWKNWQKILNTIPVTFVARPPAISLVRVCPVGMVKKTKIHWVMNGKTNALSSTKIRNSMLKQ